MRSNAPALLPLFRSQVQGELLACLLGQPEREWSVTELATTTGIPLTTAQSELMRLEMSDVIRSRKVGRNRMLRANQQHPLLVPLTHLVMHTFGPVRSVADAFAPLNPHHVLIFGSWAARASGEPGPFPADLDVLVVADDLSREAVYEAAEQVEATVGLSVNPVLRSTAAWKRRKSDPLLAEIHRRPSITILRTPGTTTKDL